MPDLFYSGQTDYIAQLNRIDSAALAAGPAATIAVDASAAATIQAAIAVAAASAATVASNAASASAGTASTAASQATAQASIATAAASQATAQAVLALASANTATTQAGIATTAASSITITRYKHVFDYGALGAGADETTQINSAISAVSAAGGGKVLFTPGKTYSHSGTIILQDNTILEGYGSYLSYTGSGVQVDTSSSNVTLNTGIEGIELIGNNASVLLSLRSAWAPVVRDITFRTDNIASVCLDLLVNTDASSGGAGLGVNIEGHRNLVFGYFSNLNQVNVSAYPNSTTGGCGTFMRLTGDGTANVQANSVITLNTFNGLNAQMCHHRGIEFVKWVDSNYFAGITRICLKSYNNCAGIGVEWNTGDPTQNVGVYADNFDHLAVDTFYATTNHVTDSRVGIRFNYTKDNKVNMFFQEPIAKGGDIIVSDYCYSYDVMHQVGLTNGCVHKSRGLDKKIEVDKGTVPTTGTSAGSLATATCTYTMGGVYSPITAAVSTATSSPTITPAINLKKLTFSFQETLVNINTDGHLYFGTTGSSQVIFSPGSIEFLRASTSGTITLGGGTSTPPLKVVPISTSAATQTVGFTISGTTTGGYPSIASNNGQFSLGGNVFFTAGKIGLGIAPASSTGIYLYQTIGTATGSPASCYGINNTTIINEGITSYIGNVSSISVGNNVSTAISSIYHTYIQDAAYGTASVTPTAQVGYYVSAAFTRASNNHAFRCDMGKATGRYGLVTTSDVSNSYFGFSSFGRNVVPIAAVDTTSIATNVVLLTTTAYTVDSVAPNATLIQTTASGAVSITLPAAGSFTGRKLHFVNQTTQVMTSTNIIPLAGGSAGTALLAGTAGKFATLQSDGTAWRIIAAN